MRSLCRSYASHDEARQAVDAVLAAGLPGSGVRVLTGEPSRDANEEPMGEFAGTAGPNAPVGRFAGGPQADPAVGAFAGGEQRGGSFADADREIVTRYPGGVEKMHVVGHGSIKRLLADAGLDDETARRDIRALHEGRVLVLVDITDADEATVAGALDG